MSPFAFSFSQTPKDWPADAGVWTGSNEQLRQYNAPTPCKWNDACVYNGCCGFVHAGEEGAGLKYFAGRCTTGADGKQIWEPACLRLIGSPRFYERRRLHLSWPAWCERQGLPKPVPLCERVVPSAAASVPAPIAVPPPAPAFLAQQMQAMQQLAVWQNFLLHQTQLPYWRRAGVTEMQAKNALGEQLYQLIDLRLQQTAANRAALGLAHPSITPGKITGMILDAHDINTLEQLLTNDVEFSRNLWQGVHVLAATAAGQDTVRAAAAADAQWSATAPVPAAY